jgi:hypothetical protein
MAHELLLNFAADGNNAVSPWCAAQDKISQRKL